MKLAVALLILFGIVAIATAQTPAQKFPDWPNWPDWPAWPPFNVVGDGGNLDLELTVTVELTEQPGNIIFVGGASALGYSMIMGACSVLFAFVLSMF